MSDVDYGPLAPLIGEWTGDSGMDVAPEPDGPEHSPYYETIVFEAIGDLDNAATQDLVALRYHQVVRRKSNDEVFHNETGYWSWDAERKLLARTLSIPRIVALVAGTHIEADASEWEVRAALDDPDWGIVQAPFMRDNARTLEFRHHMKIDGDTLIYDETTIVDIYGERFEHTDGNQLHRA